MSFIYFDCFSGISGDMLISALLDCGASFEQLTRMVESLGISAQIKLVPRTIQGIRCSSFEVNATSSPLRHLKDIEAIIEGSSLPALIKENSRAVINRLAAAEASVHGLSPSQVHFHEIGAVDTIVDIVGTFVCLDSLGIKEAYVSPLPWSGGLVSMSHGRYPLPAPATSLLLQGYPCFFSDANMELVTPTGAALITSIAVPLVDPPLFIPQKIAYGAGHNLRGDGVPNLLRVVQAESLSPAAPTESVAILEAEVDDLNPEVFSHLYHIFMAQPAVLDFFTTAIHMKKNRPGVLITLISRPDACNDLASLLLRESGSLGVRYRLQNRYVLPREERSLDTPWGPVRIKIACMPDGSLRCKPEFEDCHALALQHHVPLVEVLAAANCLARNLIK